MCNKKLKLAYPTVKIVHVNDKYLGAIRYLIMLVIAIYVGVIMIKDKRYNKCVIPDGGIELSLRKPNETIFPSNYSYCASNTNPRSAMILPCYVGDHFDVYQPVDQTDAMFIATRFSSLVQETNKNCTVGRPCLTPWFDLPNNSTNKSYYAGIELFTIQFSHFFQAREFYMGTRENYYTGSCAQMKGKLLDVEDKRILSFDQNGSDIISLETILKAADVSLEKPSEYPTNENNNETKRYAGIVLFFGIDYNGVYKDDITYTYTVTQIPKVEYKILRKTMINTDQRIITNKHGVKIFFLFSGNICKFDFLTMLINIAAFLGLLTMATVTTDFLMEYVMPLGDCDVMCNAIYSDYKYEETPSRHELIQKSKMKEAVDHNATSS